MSDGRDSNKCSSRCNKQSTIIDTFSADFPSQQVFVITGVSGSGKTDLLVSVKQSLSEKNWIFVELSAEGNLLNDLVVKLCEDPTMQSYFKKAEINLSLFGIDFGMEGVPPVYSVSTALESMLKVIQQLQKRLLIIIDDIVNTKSMRVFISEFQIFLRADYPIFLLMSGLRENAYELQNEKTLTFLYRAPKISLGEEK